MVSAGASGARASVLRRGVSECPDQRELTRKRFFCWALALLVCFFFFVLLMRALCLSPPLPLALPPPNRRTPDYMWAERKDTVHLTINLPDPVEDTPACSLSPSGRVVWVGTGGPAGATHRYRLDIQLAGGVEVAAAKKAVGARAVVFRLPKAEKGYWGKLTDKKDVHCHVDWAMWKDEDEEEEFDFGTFCSAGVAGG